MYSNTIAFSCSKKDAERLSKSELEFMGVLRHMQRYFSHNVTAQMCRWTEEEVVPTVGFQTP